jgi:flagellar basal body P-ring protein FlgI
MQSKIKLLLALSICWSLLGMATFSPVQAARIKDVAYFLGARPNNLIGYGLIVGLNGTGDNANTQFTVNTLANLLDNTESNQS